MVRWKTLNEEPSHADGPVGDVRWFREPTRREHLIAAGLFVGFGVFFIVWFGLQSGWWFRWVILGLGVFSLVLGFRHGMDAIRKRS